MDDMSDIFKRLMHADDVNLSVFLTAELSQHDRLWSLD